jgi:hypothetical protein
MISMTSEVDLLEGLYLVRRLLDRVTAMLSNERLTVKMRQDLKIIEGVAKMTACDLTDKDQRLDEMHWFIDEMKGIASVLQDVRQYVLDDLKQVEHDIAVVSEWTK